MMSISRNLQGTAKPHATSISVYNVGVELIVNHRKPRLVPEGLMVFV